MDVTDQPFAGLGKFGVILADPPWDYNDKGHTRRIDRQYQPMSLEAICALPVATLAAPDCVLFLWATVPNLPWGLEVMRAWGFEYRVNAVWDKSPQDGAMGMGHYWRVQHEHLLLGRRGRGMSAVHNLRSVLREDKTAHSVKPQLAYIHIERMFSDRRKIELFARRSRPGWTSWGNELDQESEKGPLEQRGGRNAQPGFNF